MKPRKHPLIVTTAIILSTFLLLGSGIQTIAYTTVQSGGSSVAQRTKLNFIQGSNVTLTVVDNSGTKATDVTIAAASAGIVGPNYSQPFTTQTSVTLTHNAGTTAVLIQCFDNSSPPNVLIPQNIAITNTNSATVTFGVAQSGSCVVNSSAAPANLTGTTGSIGGSPLLAGACTSGTAAVTSSTALMVAVASPSTYPGDGIWWDAQVTAGGTVTVKVCAAVAATPTASTYVVRVIQ